MFNRQNRLADNDLMRDADMFTILKRAVELGDCILPVDRTVHPMPDLTKYIPEEFYEPLVHHSPKIQNHSPLTPLEEFEEYKNIKKNKKKIVI